MHCTFIIPCLPKHIDAILSNKRKVIYYGRKRSIFLVNLICSYLYSDYYCSILNENMIREGIIADLKKYVHTKQTLNHLLNVKDNDNNNVPT